MQVIQCNQGNSTDGQQKAEKEEYLGQHNQKQHWQQVHGRDQEHLWQVGDAQQHRIDDGVTDGLTVAHQQGENQAGYQNQRQRAEADDHHHRHFSGEVQGGDNPIVQRQHGTQKNGQQPQRRCPLEVESEGSEKDLCAAVLLLLHGRQTGQHGTGGSADGEKSQAAQQP